MASAARGGLAGTVLSAVLGMVALVACIGVLVLTDDDFGGVGGTDGSGGVPGVSGGEGDGGGSGAAAQHEARTPDSTEGAVDVSQCTETSCPAAEPVSGVSPGAFPFPPGAIEPAWTDDRCRGLAETAGDTVKQVPMSLIQARDWYLTHLPAAGYGWGVGPGTQGGDANGNPVVIEWNGSVSTEDKSYAGSLSVEGFHRAQRSCGPSQGHVFVRHSVMP